MKKLLSWIQNNKGKTVLYAAILILVFLLVQEKRTAPPFYGGFARDEMALHKSEMAFDSAPMGAANYRAAPAQDMMEMESAPPISASTQRMVTKDADLSILVTKVQETVATIEQHTESINGYVVNSNITSPTENPTAYLTMRIPQEQLDATRDFIKNLGIKVVSDSVNAADITDQYEDITEKLRILRQNKTRFEEIMTQAEDVEQILQVQQQIFSLQDQIDRLVGQQQALEQESKMSRVTVFISSDELALPYVPDNAWRPGVIFKQAVRSVVETFQNAGSTLIWIGVYSVIWIPLLVIVLLVLRWQKKRQQSRGEGNL